MTSTEVRNKVIQLLEELTNNTYSGNQYQTHSAVINITNEWFASKNRNENIDEVRSDYVDDDGANVIDVWIHGEEEGFSVARVLGCGAVRWIDKNYKDCPKVKEEIQSVINNIYSYEKE